MGMGGGAIALISADTWIQGGDEEGRDDTGTFREDITGTKGRCLSENNLMR
jgi:hypothetical protein